MTLRHTTGLCCAVALGLTVSVGAQQGSSTTSGHAAQDQATTTQSTGDSASRTVTVTGCVQKETDLFETRGLGSGDEFVLTNAEKAAAGASATASPPHDGEDASDTPAVGTSGATVSASGSAHATHGAMYSLTGSREEELSRLVGRKVEVTGRVEHEGDVAASAADAEESGADAVGTSGSAATTEDEPETAGTSEDVGTTESDTSSAAGATNTGGGGRIPGREGTMSPEEIAAADGREQLERLPRVNITSFRDLGACEPQ